MKINKKKVLSIIGLLFIGAIVGGIAGAYIMASMFGRVDIGNFALEQNAEISRDLYVLQEIRSGEYEKAAESLETALDARLVFFALDHNFDKRIDNLTLMSLRRVRDYRAKYPRTTKIKEIDEALNKALSRLDANDK